MALMVAGAIAEFGTIGALVPFLALLSGQSATIHLPAVQHVEWLGALGIHDQLAAATTIFTLLVLFSGAVRLQLARSTQDFGYRLAHELITAVHGRILLQSYTFHTLRNTGTLISAIEKAEVVVFAALLPLMQAATAAILAIFVVIALLMIDPVTAAIAASVLSIMYLIASGMVRSRLAENSRVITSAYDSRLTIMQESLGGIRDVIIDASHPMYLRLFASEDALLNRARANTAFIALAPRFAVETVGMLTLIAIALIAAQREGGFAGALPALGALALGAQRLLPLVQQVYAGWSTASGNLSMISEISTLLRLPVEEDAPHAGERKPLPLKDRISLERVSFAYSGRSGPTLNDISLEIRRGSTVAVVGQTGSGKSTLADLLMGLLEPTSGQIRIDGQPLSAKNRRRWQTSIAHVPQTIFLADTSIARNIALSRGDDALDLERIIDASRRAQLHEFVETLPDGYDTLVGERGIRLSGGQRQRLGIARAIYKDTPVLVLDEATSALDPETEAAVVRELEKLTAEGRTLIVIAHRLSTIARCDCVLRVRHGSVVAVDTPSDEHAGGAPSKRRNRRTRGSGS